MPLQLYAHPFSSYCQKVLVALYENGIAFEFRMARAHAGRCHHRHRVRRAVAGPPLSPAARWRTHGGRVERHHRVPRPALPRHRPADSRRRRYRTGGAPARPLLRQLRADAAAADRVRQPAPRGRPRPLRREGCTCPARHRLRLAGEETHRSPLGHRQRFQPRRLLRRACAVLRRLDPSHPGGMRQPAGLPATPVRAPLVRPRGGRGATVPLVLPARCARPRLRRVPSAATSSSPCPAS
ncbi:glutathione S-transferase [Rhodanobacter thiooxydans LCS2]|nr:glutathione S-transferase [Rhodanobacter thiooxydans LCS2]